MRRLILVDVSRIVGEALLDFSPLNFLHGPWPVGALAVVGFLIAHGGNHGLNFVLLRFDLDVRVKMLSSLISLLTIDLAFRFSKFHTSFSRGL